MASAAERQREKAARMAANRAASPAPVADPARDERTSPVRMSVDFTPRLHAELGDWARQAARELRRPRITQVEVLRALVHELLADPGLGSRVRARIAQGDPEA